MIDRTLIRQKLEIVLEKMEQSRIQAGRKDEVQLVVVSKGQPAQIIQEAVAAGITVFGENYPEETQLKIDQIEARETITWHMIGHLQSRKAKIVGEYFFMLHSLDSVRLAQVLNAKLIQLDKKMPCLLEVNVSGEASKYGFKAWDDENWENLLPQFQEIGRMSNLVIQGLMTMPPFSPDPEEARPFFIKTRRLQEFLSRQIPQIQWVQLSMGTSGDFEVAIAEGASMVRIGTAILGSRPA